VHEHPLEKTPTVLEEDPDESVIEKAQTSAEKWAQSTQEQIE
jgi:hypothetical protein